MTDLKTLLIDTASIMSISGSETLNAGYLKQLIGDIFDEYSSDHTGNQLFVKHCGLPNAPRLLIDTHFDEIGMMVIEIKDGGFLRVTPIGGLDARIMMASEVVIYGKETITGIVASIPPHLQKADDSKKLPNINELLIDTGYSKKKLVEIVELGTLVGFKPNYTELQNGFISGKGFDNKSCAASAAYAVKLIGESKISWDIYLLLSSREETNLLGARVGTFKIEPNAAIVIDVNFSDAPDTPSHQTIKAGSGSSVSLSAVTDRSLTNAILDYAKAHELKCQTVVESSSTGTNADIIPLVSRGVPVAVMSLPLRNMHTYNEIINTDDAESLSKLLAEFIKEGVDKWYKA